jgi:hypothetical protein
MKISQIHFLFDQLKFQCNFKSESLCTALNCRRKNIWLCLDGKKITYYTLYVVRKYEQNNVFFLGTMNKNNVEGKHDDCMNHENRKHMFDMPLTESGSGILSEQN